MSATKRLALSAACTLLFTAQAASAQILPVAEVMLKIPLTSKPTSRPMTVAYMPSNQRYYIADGGLGPVPGDMENPLSRSEVHVYSADGHVLQTAKPGLNNRSIYFNPNTGHLETVTYDISSDVGFLPNSGIYSLIFLGNGDLKDDYDEVSGFNPAFGDAATIPSYDPQTRHYFAKQERSNKVFVVEPPKREKVGEIDLDLNAAGARFDDVSDHYIAFTGITGEELALLDVDHRAVLVFDLQGKLVGKCALPAGMKLHAENHYNGLGYANGMVFVYQEREGEFGTYYGLKISDKAVQQNTP